MQQFAGKTLLITGGTGTFGRTVLKRFMAMNLAEIRIFSRDEKKQDDLRKDYNQQRNLKFYLGDVRDYSSVLNVCRGVDYIFHAAALKQVPSCEFHPLEAVKTNILGTENVLEAALTCKVRNVVCLSTDKAVYPINAMGMSKALMEKIMIAKSVNLDSQQITLCGTRYGNIMASRGSVIPLFINQVLQGTPITVTNPNMTRFMMTPNQAVDLVLHAFTHGICGDIFVQKSPATSINNIALAVRELLGKPDHPINYIGTRHGEKLFESLVSSEEMLRAINHQQYYRIPADNRDLNYSKYFEIGNPLMQYQEGYNSHNTQQLNLEQTKDSMLQLASMRKLITDAADCN